MVYLPFINRALLCCLLITAACGCGYTVGGDFSPHIRSVHVPTFTSDDYRRGYEQQLTEAVQRQIQTETPYRLTSAEMADTILTGHIVGIEKRVSNQNEFDDPRELELNISIVVTWQDARTGEILAERQIALDPALAQLQSQISFAPEVGQSLATGTQDAVNQLARDIVSMMHAAW
jgi:hypothetical protein